MIQRLIPSGVAAAIAGGTMAVALSCGPSFAFTLSAPSLAQSAVKADVQQVDYNGQPTITLTTTIITTTHIASVTMYPRRTPTITPTITLPHPYHYDHYNNSYRVRHYVPKTNPYHNY